MYMMVKKKSTSVEIDKKTSLNSNASKDSEVLLNSIIPLKLATDQSLKVIQKHKEVYDLILFLSCFPNGIQKTDAIEMMLNRNDIDASIEFLHNYSFL